MTNSMTSMADCFHIAVILMFLLFHCDALLISDNEVSNEQQDPVQSTELGNVLEGLYFLKKYQYITVDSNKDTDFPSNGEISGALVTMQKFAGIEQTGKFDDPTIEMMRRPRCGVPDVVVRVQVPEGPETLRRLRRYNIAGKNYYRWFTDLLTYTIDNYPSQTLNNLNAPLSHVAIDNIVESAFKVWSDVSPLQFTKVARHQRADIHLLFGARSHTSVSGDPVFDGSGGTLAHAFTPNSGWGNTNGDVHFDDDETFTDKIYSGSNLFYTSAHEIGHALGLDHSANVNALMWPYERGYQPNFRLPADDVAGIQAIYGPKPTAKPPPPRYCNVTFNAVAVIYQKLYLFAGDLLWQFTMDGDLLTNPDGEEQRDHFKRLPRNIQCVYERWYDGRVIFLKGEKFYVYDGSKQSPQGGQLIKQQLSPYLPKSISAAIHSRTTGSTDFLRGKKVWRYDEIYGYVKAGFPKKLHPNAFPGLPSRPTGAFEDKTGNAIILKDRGYYRYSRTSQGLYEPVNGVITPKSFAQDFLSCPEPEGSSLQQRP